MGNTVWYELTLGADTDVMVDTAGSDYDTVLAVWTGSDLSALDLVECVDDTFTGLQAAVRFTAAAGVTYRVQVGAFNEASEPSTLMISFAEPGKVTGRPLIQKSSFRGTSASAFSEMFDEENGAFMFAEVQVSESREKSVKGKPFVSSQLWVSLSEQVFDETAGTVTSTNWFGFAELDADDYSLDRRLNGAAVAAAVTMSGQMCVEGPFDETENGVEFDTVCTELGPVDVAVDVVWDGTGPVFHQRFNERFSSEGFRSSTQSKGTSREAVVVGGFAGDGLAFDFGGTQGFLSRSANASMVVYRGPGFFVM
jgi:hypothetical protein